MADKPALQGPALPAMELICRRVAQVPTRQVWHTLFPLYLL
jgi:hypothetical protein